MKRVLTIAGSDCSGGAGIQADIKTITAHNMYAMSAITALTAQNTTGVYGIAETTPDFVSRQLDCIFQDIRPDAVKIGMVANGEIIKTIVKKLKEYQAVHIVVDPVMVATSGSNLLYEEALQSLKQELLPIATIIPPNLTEAEALARIRIVSEDDMLKAAEKIQEKIPGAILIKGGHLTNSANDLLYHNGQVEWFYEEQIANPNTHGTGCTLSSAIACNLAAGYTLTESVKNAKAYITGALKAGLNLGKGNGPLNHMYQFSIKE